MADLEQLGDDRLEEQIREHMHALRAAQEDAQLRHALKILLLEKERRQIAHLSDTQLASAIGRYQGKVSAGDRRAAKILERLQKENAARESSRSNRGTRQPKPTGVPSNGLTAPPKATTEQTIGLASRERDHARSPQPTRRWRRLLPGISILACLGASGLLGHLAGYQYGCWQAADSAGRKGRRAEPFNLQASGYYTARSLSE